MPNTDHHHDQTILAALVSLGAPADAYMLARLTDLSVPEAGRALMRLRENNRVQCMDELGTANDLAARFVPSSEPH